MNWVRDFGMREAAQPARALEDAPLGMRQELVDVFFGRVARLSDDGRVRHLCSGCPVLALFARAGSDAADATFVRSAQTPLRMRSWCPPFANNAKDVAPHCVGDASEIKSLGHPPPRRYLGNVRKEISSRLT